VNIQRLMLNAVAILTVFSVGIVAGQVATSNAGLVSYGVIPVPTGKPAVPNKARGRFELLQPGDTGPVYADRVNHSVLAIDTKPTIFSGRSRSQLHRIVPERRPGGPPIFRNWW